MISALIAGAAVVLAGLIAVIGQWLNSRNDRQLTLLEVELHSKMPSEAKAARLELEHVIDDRIHRWYLRTHPFERSLRAAWVGVAFAFLFLATGILVHYVTDRAALATKLSDSTPGFLAIAKVGAYALLALAVAILLAGVVWSIWPRTRPPGWNPKPRETPLASAEAQGNGDTPNAKDVALKQPSTPPKDLLSP
jgi:hypothetical protein